VGSDRQSHDRARVSEGADDDEKGGSFEDRRSNSFVEMIRNSFVRVEHPGRQHSRERAPVRTLSLSQAQACPAPRMSELPLPKVLIAEEEDATRGTFVPMTVGEGVAEEGATFGPLEA
jgi:hypothetical protein